MMMDTRIPLAGQTPDIIGNLSRGQSAADIFNKQKAEQTERLFLRENGQALSAGDPGALQAYANINLEGSMALQSHFEAKRKAEAARAAAAANAATEETEAKEKRRIGAGMAALTVEQARINAMDVSDEEKTEEFLRAQASILRPETRAMMAKQGIHLTLGNLDTYFTRLSGDFDIDWKPNVAAPPKTTDDITEYNAAKDGGFQGTFADWMGKTKATGSPVDFPYAIPSGFMPVDPQDPNKGVKPLVGYPASDGEGIPSSLEGEAFILKQADISMDSPLGVSFLAAPDEMRSAMLGAHQQGLEFGTPEWDTFIEESVGYDSTAESALRKEYMGQKSFKNYVEQSEGMGRLVQAAKMNSAAGDLALVFSYMKVLDPTSVVRESEFKTAEEASAWLQRSEELGIYVPRSVAVAIRKAATGDRLGDEQRRDFLTTANNMYVDATKNYKKRRDFFVGVAESKNLDVNTALPDYSRTYDIDAELGGDADTIPMSVASHPSILKAAKGAGVTPQDVWDKLPTDAKKKFMESE